MDSARQYSKVIRNYLAKEQSRGWLLGPFSQSMVIPGLQINHFGVILNGHKTAKWYHITDLSFPLGKNVNDGINTDLCSITYTTVNRVARFVVHLGVCTILGKLDI